MEFILRRYRNIIVLLTAICSQLVLLAWQVKSDSDVPLVRVWAVTAVAPVAGAIEALRSGTTGFFSNYFELRHAREQSRELRTEVDKLRLENQLLKNELGSAQRAESLAGFQAHTPSKMIGARVIGATPGIGTKSLLIDRGSQSGVRRGMAVVTPDGIVGSVIAVFPFNSQVRSVTDPGFAAGVESQKNHVHGVLKGLGTSSARVDYVPTGQKLEVGEMFYTDGEDRIFPKGLPVGKITSVHEGANFQDVTVQPAGTEAAPEEVLVILDPVHQAIPEAPAADAPVFLAPDVTTSDNTGQSGAALTTADKLRQDYKKIGEAQNHVFGVGNPGTLPPNFNLKVPGVNAPAQPSTGTAPEKVGSAPGKKLDATGTAQPRAPAAATPKPAETGTEKAAVVRPPAGATPSDKAASTSDKKSDSTSTAQPRTPTPSSTTSASPKPVPPASPKQAPASGAPVPDARVPQP